MRMLVVRIRKMGVAVGDGQMAMPVHVFATGHSRWIVVVLVMHVIDPMHMGVAVFQRGVVVRVPMMFGQMQCYSHGHQKPSHQPLNGDGFT